MGNIDDDVVNVFNGLFEFGAGGWMGRGAERLIAQPDNS